MKYIKTFEDLGSEFNSDEYNIHFKLTKYLNSIKEPGVSVNSNYHERGEKNGIAIAFQYRDPKDRRFSSISILFIIRILNVTDKKLRDYTFSPKKKIKITKYDHNLKNNELGSILYEFIIETFKKYSYYNNNIDFFINTKDIPDIIKELNEDFDMYRNTKKYNI